MERRRRVALAVAAALVFGVALAGAGVARVRGESAGERFVARVAELLGKDPAEVRSAMQRAHDEIVDEAVERGNVSQERAQRIKQRATEVGFPLRGHGRRAFTGRVAERSGDVLSVETPRGVRRVRLDRETLIRNPGGAGEDALREGARIRVKGRRTGPDGVLDARKVRVLPARKGLTRGLLGQGHDISAALGLRPGELRTELRKGKSLAEIAGPEKTPRVIAILTAAARERLDAAVAEGRLPAERAAERKRGLAERIERLVTRERQPRGRTNGP